MANRFRILLAGLLALASAIAGAGPVSPPEAATTSHEANERAAQAVRAVAGGRRLILLGELHGTREVPEVVAKLATSYAAEEPVLIAVEIDHAEQPAIDTYLRTDGGRRARDVLRDRPYWQRPGPVNDGRRNEALIDLFEHVRRLRRAGRDVAVLAFDVTRTPDHHARDRGMDTVLRAAYAALPRGRLIVVAGNVHAMLERPSGAPPMMQTPAGACLRDLDPVSFRITARSGEFWACLETCGPRAADGGGQRTGPTDGAYHHMIVLPRHRLAPLIGDARTH